MKTRFLAISLALFVILSAVGIVWAQTSPNYDLTWHVLSPGGSEWGSSGTHMVNGTLSQLAIGPAAASGGHRDPSASASVRVFKSPLYLSRLGHCGKYAVDLLQCLVR